MSKTGRRYCQLCNDRNGRRYWVVLETLDGTVENLDLRFCEGCSESLDEHDWVTLDFADQHSERTHDPERTPELED